MNAERHHSLTEGASIGELLDFSFMVDMSHWRRGKRVDMESQIVNKSGRIVTLLVKPYLRLYHMDSGELGYEAVIDLSNAQNLGPRRFSVISLGVGDVKTVIMHLEQLKFRDVKGLDEWPMEDLYSVVRGGRYRLCFEIDIYDNLKSKVVDSLVSRCREIEVEL